MFVLFTQGSIATFVNFYYPRFAPISWFSLLFPLSTGVQYLYDKLELLCIGHQQYSPSLAKIHPLNFHNAANHADAVVR